MKINQDIFFQAVTLLMDISRQEPRLGSYKKEQKFIKNKHLTQKE